MSKPAHTHTTSTKPVIDPVASAAVVVLIWGFRIATALMAIGVVISIIRQDALKSTLPSLGSVIGNLFDLEGSAFIGLSIFAIVLTPVFATLAIVVAFYRAGDRRYVLWSLAMLAVLAFSVALSQG